MPSGAEQDGRVAGRSEPGAERQGGRSVRFAGGGSGERPVAIAATGRGGARPVRVDVKPREIADPNQSRLEPTDMT